MLSSKIFIPQHLEELIERNEKENNKFSFAIKYIDKFHPLQLQSTILHHAGSIFNMTWSHDGNLLATASTIGSIKIWDVNEWKLVKEINDNNV